MTEVSFSPEARDYIKSYVYALIDPRDEKPFYIGKGVGDRVFTHGCGDPSDPNRGPKSLRIQEIADAKLTVRRVILRWGLDDDQATLVESVLIDFASNHDLLLTNKVRGKDAQLIGYTDAKGLAMRLNAPLLAELYEEDLERVVIVNINRTYKSVDPNAEDRYYQAAHAAWGIAGKKIENLRYVLAEIEGLIVAAFAVKEWHQREPDKKWWFERETGEPLIAKRYVGRRIYKKPGDRSQFRYKVNPEP